MFPVSCRREHSALPYQWEVKEGSEWKALPDNEAIEKDYCSPARTYRCVKENTLHHWVSVVCPARCWDAGAGCQGVALLMPRRCFFCCVAMQLLRCLKCFFVCCSEVAKVFVVLVCCYGVWSVSALLWCLEC